MNKSIIYIWLFSLACVFVQPVRVYDEMPDTIASKFDANGNATEYTTKEQFIFLWSGVAVFVNGIMLGVATILWKVAPHTLNIPSKQYWLSNETRKKEAQGKLANGLALIATICNLLFIIVFQALYKFSIEGKLPFSLLWVLIGYFVLMMGVIFYFLRSFRIPPETEYIPGIR